MPGRQSLERIACSIASVPFEGELRSQTSNIKACKLGTGFIISFEESYIFGPNIRFTSPEK
jgi:hypothetical protein